MNYKTDWRQFSDHYRLFVFLKVPMGMEADADWLNALLMGGEIAR